MLPTLAATGTATLRARAPGPRPTPATLVRFRRDPLAFLLDLPRYGDVVRFRIVGRTDYFLVNDPVLIQRVLTADHRLFRKSRSMQQAKRIIGEGLLTSEGELHHAERRILQRGFVPSQIGGYADSMLEVIDDTQRRWSDGDVLDLHRQMYELTLRVIGRTLFSTEVGDHAANLNEALNHALRWVGRLTLPYADVWEHLPLPALRRLRGNVTYLQETMRGIVGERRALGQEPDDLFTLLLRAQSGGADHLTDELIEEEVATLFFAGHETTAALLTWSWYLLARNPEVESRVHAELDEVLGGRPPTVDDLPQLETVKHVLLETLRLYPPVWNMGREALADYELHGHHVPAGSILSLTPWVTHRDARWYPEPARFDPDRWAKEERSSRPRYAFFPFGGGPRICLGEDFAWLEAMLTLAHVGRHWRVRPVSETEARPAAWLTLRPSERLLVRMERRL